MSISFSAKVLAVRGEGEGGFFVACSPEGRGDKYFSAKEKTVFASTSPKIETTPLLPAASFLWKAARSFLVICETVFSVPIEGVA